MMEACDTVIDISSHDRDEERKSSKLETVSSVSTSSVPTSMPPPPPSPTKSSRNEEENTNMPPIASVEVRMNGDKEDRDHAGLTATSFSPPPNNSKQSHSGTGTHKMTNIKIKKQYSKIYRIKTKILQNLGKADKTTDEIFDDYETNFNQQQLNANRLHKEISNYLRCARALHGASKSLFEALSEVYEPEWVGHDLLYVQAQNSDMLWTDFCHKIQDQTLVPLTAYTQEFPEIRKKIDKRGRKLVDFDSQRHQLENLQRNTRRDEYKIARVKDQLEGARSTYETLNKELYCELPNIFDERIPNTANSLQTLFAAEATFMQESCKISQELEAISDKLSKECSKGTYNMKRGCPPKATKSITAAPRISSSQNSTALFYDEMNNDGQSSQSPQGPQEIQVSLYEGVEKGKSERNGKEEGGTFGKAMVEEEATETFKNEEPPSPPAYHITPPSSPCPALPAVPPPDSPQLSSSPEPQPQAEPFSQSPRKSKEEKRSKISNPSSPAKEETGRPYEEIEFEDKKVNGATTEGLPSGVLYRVRATYKYVREDVDELGFEVGETIQVVEYDDPEEQEEGWLCGIKETTNEKGLFPANFTRPI